MIVRLARFIATAGGAGYSPVAPGTAGTVVAVVLAWLLGSLSAPLFGALTVITTVIGIWAASVSDRSWQTHDSGRIVIDEVAGYWVTIALIDRTDLLALGCAFVIFRALDIAKPPPIRQIDRSLGGGTGVVLDDVGAGIYGLLLMLLGSWLGLWGSVIPGIGP